MSAHEDQASRSAAVVITKLGAAERQLNAACRMVLAGEDELAIYTVTAAAYRLLRDIEKSRGRNPAADFLARAYIGAAEELAAGSAAHLEDVPDPSAVEIIRDIAQGLADGRDPTVSEVSRRITVPHQGIFWEYFNITSNFLKHADKDSNKALLLGGIEERTKQLLLFACVTFCELLGRETPEMLAFIAFAAGASEGFRRSFWSDELVVQFSKASLAQRRQICRRLLKFLRGKGKSHLGKKEGVA